MKPTTIKELSELICAHLGYACTFIRAVPVQMVYKERTLWDGKVGVFQLAHSGRECYAWADDALMGDTYPVIIMQSPTITTPTEAVKWYLEGLCDAAPEAPHSSVQHAA